MTKKDTDSTRKPVPEGRKQGRGGAYVDGKRVGGTEPAETKPDPKRVNERKARREVKNG